MNIPFNKVYKTVNEEKYVLDSLNSGRHSGNNSYCKKVISLMKERHSFNDIFLTTSCTSALEMGAMLTDLNHLDEVIVPSYTFSSTVNAIINYGAHPVFCEVDPKTMNIDPNKIEELITENTKMIIAIDYAGISCEIDKIMKIGKKHNLLVMQDCAQSYSSYYLNKACGTQADLATFSFHETKNYNAGGEGGALVVNNKNLVERAYYLQEKGTDRTKVLHGVKTKYHWVDKGSSFLLSDILASILFSQLESELDIKKMRSNVTKSYSLFFEKNNHYPIQTISFPENCDVNHHAYWIVFDNIKNKELFLSNLKSCNVHAYIGYTPLHSSPMGLKLGYQENDLPITFDLGNRIVRLPFYNELQGEKMTYCIDSIQKVLKMMYD